MEPGTEIKVEARATNATGTQATLQIGGEIVRECVGSEGLTSSTFRPKASVPIANSKKGFTSLLLDLPAIARSCPFGHRFYSISGSTVATLSTPGKHVFLSTSTFDFVVRESPESEEVEKLKAEVAAINKKLNPVTDPRKRITVGLGGTFDFIDRVTLNDLFTEIRALRLPGVPAGLSPPTNQSGQREGCPFGSRVKCLFLYDVGFEVAFSSGRTLARNASNSDELTAVEIEGGSYRDFIEGGEGATLPVVVATIEGSEGRHFDHVGVRGSVLKRIRGGLYFALSAEFRESTGVSRLNVQAARADTLPRTREEFVRARGRADYYGSINSIELGAVERAVTSFETLLNLGLPFYYADDRVLLDFHLSAGFRSVRVPRSEGASLFRGVDGLGERTEEDLVSEQELLANRIFGRTTPAFNGPVFTTRFNLVARKAKIQLGGEIRVSTAANERSEFTVYLARQFELSKIAELIGGS